MKRKLLSPERRKRNMTKLLQILFAQPQSRIPDRRGLTSVILTTQPVRLGKGGIFHRRRLTGSLGFKVIDDDFYRTLLSYRFNGTEVRIILFVYYYTVGYHKEYTKLTNSFIGEGLGLNSGWASQVVRRLIIKKVLFRDGQKLAVNRNVSDWQVEKR